MTTSRPVFSWPSASTATRLRRSLSSERLVRFSQAELPRHARVLDGT